MVKTWTSTYDGLTALWSADKDDAERERLDNVPTANTIPNVDPH
jgi:hypothetical protein